MLDLIALFDFEVLEPESEEKRYGEGSVKIQVEREPETVEDYNEIAKAIFKNGGYAQIAVKRVFYDDNNLFEALANPQKPENFDPETYKLDQTGEAGILDENDVIVGEIVDE